MNLRFGNVLGEKILDGGSWSIHRNGIATQSKYILWENVEEVYISGSIATVRFIIPVVPGGEKRTLTIVDSSKNRIKVNMSGFFRMSYINKQNFSDIYAFILRNIVERQREQFLQCIENGQKISFNTFEIGHDGIYCTKFFGGHQKIKLSDIIGCDIRNGNFYIQYRDINGAEAEKNMYLVENIPNIHIAQMFIKEINKIKDEFERGSHTS